jgi:hypothetical protein
MVKEYIRSWKVIIIARDIKLKDIKWNYKSIAIIIKHRVSKIIRRKQ